MQNDHKMINIARPQVSEEAIDKVSAVLRSGMLADGEHVREFERRFASYCGMKYGIATSSGTTALHIALLSLGIGDGEKAVTTPFSFIATSNSILYCNAEPVFVDIDDRTFNIDPDAIEQELQRVPEINTIVIVHLFGNPCEMNTIMEIARRYNVKVVEDCAQAHGAEYCGQKVGSFGDIAIFSFYPTKNMTTGEGGMIVTDNEELAGRCSKLVNHGRLGRYEHDILGFNYRMTNIAAVIGLDQLEKLDRFNQKRIQNAKFLTDRLSDLPWLETPFTAINCKHVYHQYTIKTKEREELSQYLLEKGIRSAVVYPMPLYQQPLYKCLGHKANCPVTESITQRVLSLPIHPALSQEDLERIANAVIDFV